MVLEKRLLFERTPLDIPNLAFFLWAVVTTVTSVDPQYSLSEIRGEVGTYLLIFYLAVNNIKGEDQIKKLIRSLSLGALLMSLYGIYQFIIFKGSFLSPSVRINSFTQDYNYLATYLINVVPLVFVQIYFTSGWLRTLVYVISFLGIFTTYLTHTRAAWFAFVSQMILYGLLTRNKKILTGMLAGFVVIIVFFSLKGTLMHEVTVVSPEGEIIKRDTSISRLVMWQEGMEKIKMHPITGIGYGRESFMKAFPDSRITKTEGGLWHTHNAFLDTALEIGIPGVFFLVFQLVLFIKIYLRAFLDAEQSFPKALFLGLLLIIFGFLARNQFDHLYVDDPVMMFWFLMGMGMGLVLKMRKTELHRESPAWNAQKTVLPGIKKPAKSVLSPGGF